MNNPTVPCVLCINCKFHHAGYLKDYCKRKENKGKRSLVTGAQVTGRWEQCSQERTTIGFFDRLLRVDRCGAEGKYWTPRD